MCFRDSRQFKKALLKYGVKTHRHLRFDKDEAKKGEGFLYMARMSVDDIWLFDHQV
jgi:hypothetical protein